MEGINVEIVSWRYPGMKGPDKWAVKVNGENLRMENGSVHRFNTEEEARQWAKEKKLIE